MGSPKHSVTYRHLNRHSRYMEHPHDARDNRDDASRPPAVSKLGRSGDGRQAHRHGTLTPCRSDSATWVVRRPEPPAGVDSRSPAGTPATPGTQAAEGPSGKYRATKTSDQPSSGEAPNHKLATWLAILAMVLEDNTISIIRGPPRHRDMGPWFWDAPRDIHAASAAWVSRDGFPGQRCVGLPSYFLSLTAPSKTNK